MNSIPVPTAVAVCIVCCAMIAPPCQAAESEPSQISWSNDYAATMAAAQREAAVMVVYFRDEDDPRCRQFDDEISASTAAQKHLAACRCVRLPLDAKITSGGESIRLAQHPAFSELQGQPGLVVLDFTILEASQRGQVLRTMALHADRDFKAQQLDFLPSRPEPASTPPPLLDWMSDYTEATTRAEREGRMLLIYFQRADTKGGCAGFEATTLADDEVLKGLDSYVCLKIPHDATVNLDGNETVLLKYAPYAEMVGLPGIAIVDHSNPEAPYYRQVVGAFPFLQGKPYSPRQMKVILDLPPGKLTQRTLIYAVRTHPDAPQSTSGRFDQYLASEAESHSNYQARIRLQGHHTWENRFHRINRRLPAGLLATEVCAESWPGESLLEAAIDCVQCWRASSGHWRSVRAAHPVFGYDMRRGSNGIWYATGIFGKRHY